MTTPADTTPQPKETAAERINRLKMRFEPWQWLAGIIIGFLSATIISLIAIFVTFPSIIEEKSRAAVLDEKFLSQMAARIRPSCVFNMKGAILTEVGTADYVKAIKVQKGPAEHQFIVLVDAKRHLNYPPLVDCISYNLHTTEAIPTEGYGWKITLAATVAFMTEKETEGFLFRLEILH